MGENRSRFAAEDKNARFACVIEWFLAEAVSRQQYTSRKPVDDGKGKHAVQPQRQIPTPFAVPMDQDFGIRVRGAESMTRGFEFAPEREMIVYFAIENDANIAARIPHRLGASSDVD